jgi:SHS2 domain-containing protein
MSYELLDHVSEVELRLRAPTWPKLLVEAARALTARLWDGAVPAAGDAGRWFDVRLQAADRASLLVDWLNELLYLAEAEWWLPVEFVIDEASDQSLLARVRGLAVPHAPAAIKAATLHGLNVAPGRDDDLEATVVFDV